MDQAKRRFRAGKPKSKASHESLIPLCFHDLGHQPADRRFAYRAIVGLRRYVRDPTMRLALALARQPLGTAPAQKFLVVRVAQTLRQMIRAVRGRTIPPGPPAPPRVHQIMDTTPPRPPERTFLAVRRIPAGLQQVQEQARRVREPPLPAMLFPD